MCSIFWLFCWSCQYLLSDWLERLLWESLIMARGLPPQSPGRKYLRLFWFSVLVHCLIVYLSCPPALHNTFHTPMAWYSLFVLKVPLNTNRLTLVKFPYWNTFGSTKTCLNVVDWYIIIIISVYLSSWHTQLHLQWITIITQNSSSH